MQNIMTLTPEQKKALLKMGHSKTVQSTPTSVNNNLAAASTATLIDKKPVDKSGGYFLSSLPEEVSDFSAGFAEGATVGYVSPDTGRDESTWMRVIGKGVGFLLPLTKINQAVNAARIFSGATRTSRVLQSGTVGAIAGGIEKPIEGESRVDNAAIDAGVFAGIQVGAEIISPRISRFVKNGVDVFRRWRKLRKDATPEEVALNKAEGVFQPEAKEGLLPKIVRAKKDLQTSLISEYTPVRDAEKELLANVGLKKPSVDTARSLERVQGSPAHAEADYHDFMKRVIRPIRGHEKDLDTYLFLKRVENRLDPKYDLALEESIDTNKLMLETIDDALKGGGYDKKGIAALNKEAKALKAANKVMKKDIGRKVVGDWTLKDAQMGLSGLRRKVGGNVMASLENAGKEFQQATKKALRLQVESGRLSKDALKEIEKWNDFYAPFKVLQRLEAFEDAAIKDGSGVGRSVVSTALYTRKIRGIQDSDFKIGSILQSTVEQLYKSRMLADKNRKMLEVVNLARLDRAGKFFKMRLTQKGALPQRKKIDVKADRGFQRVPVYVKGKLVEIQARDDIAKSLSGLNQAQVGQVGKVASLTATPFRWGATTANVAFQVANHFGADIPRALLVSKYGVRSPVDLIKFPSDWAYSWFTALTGNFGKRNELYMEWLKSGAARSTVQQELTPGAFGTKLKVLGEKKSAGGKVIESIAHFANAVEEATKIMGLKRGLRIRGIKDFSLTRGMRNLKKYDPVKDKEKIERVLGEIATEVRNYSGSPDFMRRGVDTRGLNLLFMFFNARIQGVAADFARLAGKDGTSDAAWAWGRLSTAIGVPTTALAILNNKQENRDDYMKINKEERDNYFMIPMDLVLGDDHKTFTNDKGDVVRNYYKIPKREIVKLFSNMIESAVEFSREKSPEALARYGISFLEGIAPVNISGKNFMERFESVISSANPLAKGAVEFGTGRDTFFHRDTVPEYLKEVRPDLQYKKNTPEYYIEAGKAMGISPLVLEQTVKAFSAGLVTQFTIKEPEGDRDAITQYPVIKRFVRSSYVDDAETEIVQKFILEQGSNRVLRRKSVEDLYERIKENDTGNGRGFIESYNRVRKQDPLIAKALLKVYRDDKLGLDYKDRLIKTLGVNDGTRARYVIDRLSRLDTDEQRIEFLRELATKRLLPKKVRIQLMRSGVLNHR